MEVALGTLLFVAKWLLIGLIYLALFIVLVAVRREMRQRLQSHTPVTTSAAPGRLRVVSSVGDPRLKPGQLIMLPNDVVLGTDPSQLRQQDLRLNDEFVSSRHAFLSWDGVRWWIEDLGSTNGTLVNGRELMPHQREIIPFGAALQVGDVVFELLE
ncbi:MAG: FHA domain-containing protein [Chloroflexi bacterium]|nr:FHA domain-containing protein [Chloroflexota bacterium]MCI0575788.1 FHA domain-containing protein [Chloroflexota bacterium]MCI0647967.1 FHA domain-containing protein [Chloroflexota bacterium]MCI0726823.1 FHA domain-containing protein [Chloroflexota bacterium]